MEIKYKLGFFLKNNNAVSSPEKQLLNTLSA